MSIEKTEIDASNDQYSDEEKERIPEVFFSTVQKFGSRATFIGGFSYYSIGRYQYSCCVSKVYIAFNTMAFVFSLVTAGVATIYCYYLERELSTQAKFKFCMDGLWFERFISRMFCLSVATYLISIGLLGFSYYPNTQWKWFPLAVTVIAVFVFYYGLSRVIVRQSLFQTNYGLGDEKRLIDPAKIVAESKYKDRTGQKLEDSVMNRAATISGRAIFIAGLAQNGIMRYQPDPVEFKDTNFKAPLFLVMTTLAFVLAFVSGCVLQIILVFIPDTVKSKQTAYTVLLMPLFRICNISYVLSFFALFLANIYISNGCNFEDLAYITRAMGGVGFCIALFAMFVYVKEKVFNRDEAHKDRAISKDASSSEHDEQQLQVEMTAINTAGSMSTFAAGYLYYNLVTFDTDVLRLSWNDPIDANTRLFLWANMITITFALVAAVQDTLISLIVNYYQSAQARLVFIRSYWILCRSCTWYYYLSLIGWFVVFGLFGVVKFSHYSYAPFAYALSGIAMMVCGMGYLSNVRHQVARGGHLPSEVSDEEVWKQHGRENVNNVINRHSLLSSIAFTVIFLGGYAYFAICFFNFNNRRFELVYLHAMSISFMTSMWVMVFADRYSYQMAKCTSIAAKYQFAQSTYYFYIGTISLAYVVVVSLLIGFIVLGNIKTISNYKEVQGIVSFSVLLIIALVLPVLFWLVTVYNEVKSTTFETQIAEKNDTRIVAQENIDRFRKQILSGVMTAGYIAGNVCYEILFSDANSQYDIANYYYFFTMTLTFATGIAAIVLATVATLCLGEISGLEGKTTFISKIKYLKLMIFVLSLGSLFFWQASVIALGEVKYTGDKKLNEPSVVLGVSGLVVLVWALHRMKRISDGAAQGVIILSLPKCAMVTKQSPLHNGVGKEIIGNDAL